MTINEDRKDTDDDILPPGFSYMSPVICRCPGCWPPRKQDYSDLGERLQQALNARGKA
jgi:hypothetical protein